MYLSAFLFGTSALINSKSAARKITKKSPPFELINPHKPVSSDVPRNAIGAIRISPTAAVINPSAASARLNNTLSNLSIPLPAR